MVEDAGEVSEVSPQLERRAAERARERASNARWSLEIAVFLFAILILVIMLATYTKAGIEIVAPVAIIGLALVWIVGWRRGKQLYQRFYDEEISQLERNIKKALEATVRETVVETIEETIEERVQKALRQRWR